MEAPRAPQELLAEHIRQWGPIAAVRLIYRVARPDGREAPALAWGRIHVAPDGWVVAEWSSNVYYEFYQQAERAYEVALQHGGAVPALRWGPLSQEDCLEVLYYVVKDDDLLAEAIAWREIGYALQRLAWADGGRW